MRNEIELGDKFKCLDGRCKGKGIYTVVQLLPSGNYLLEPDDRIRVWQRRDTLNNHEIWHRVEPKTEPSIVPGDLVELTSAEWAKDRNYYETAKSDVGMTITIMSTDGVVASFIASITWTRWPLSAMRRVEERPAQKWVPKVGDWVNLLEYKTGLVFQRNIKIENIVSGMIHWSQENSKHSWFIDLCKPSKVVDRAEDTKIFDSNGNSRPLHEEKKESGIRTLSSSDYLAEMKAAGVIEPEQYFVKEPVAGKNAVITTPKPAADYIMERFFHDMVEAMKRANVVLDPDAYKPIPVAPDCKTDGDHCRENEISQGLYTSKLEWERERITTLNAIVKDANEELVKLQKPKLKELGE